jgi:predicted DNA-binding transcriptional regulator AlpA
MTAKKKALTSSAQPIKTNQAGGELRPNEIVRKKDGFKYFGLKRTALDDAIKNNLIPKPFPLTKDGRAVGWTGQQILDHQRKLLEQANTN